MFGSVWVRAIWSHSLIVCLPLCFWLGWLICVTAHATLCLLAFRGQQSLRYSECRMPQLASFWACHHVTTSARHLWNCTGCQYVIASSSNWRYWCSWHTRTKSPAYISDVTQPVSRDLSRSRLRSADTTDFIVPRTRTKFGERAFCVSGPTIWNSLPESLRSITCTATFKRHLKTHFFNIFLS